VPESMIIEDAKWFYDKAKITDKSHFLRAGCKIFKNQQLKEIF